jgi:hypothetical protein
MTETPGDIAARAAMDELIVKNTRRCFFHGRLLLNMQGTCIVVLHPEVGRTDSRRFVAWYGSSILKKMTSSPGRLDEYR